MSSGLVPEPDSPGAVRTTALGPTSRQSRTATVLSESESALVSVTGPKYSRE